MEKELLTDESILPNDEIIKTALGEEQFKIYSDFIMQIKKMNLIIEWKFYKDLETWLGKILNKSKIVGWLSIWNVGFKITFYFNEKTLNGLNDLNLNNDINVLTSELKPFGKILPRRITINNNLVLSDTIKILEYKMKIK